MVAPAVAGSVLIVLLCLLLVMREAVDFALLLRGAAGARRYRSTGFAGDALLKSPLIPGVAVIAVPPDASEESRLQIRSLLEMRSGDAEVIAVLNSATDAERALWMDEFQLECEAPGIYRPRNPAPLRVIDRQRGTFAECLNTAAALTEKAVIAIADRDVEVSEECLLVAMEHFLAGDGRMIALCVGGPAQAVSGWPALSFRLEYLRNWLVHCALASGNCALALPGSLTLFDRETVLRLGGFRGGPVEMVVRLHRMLRAARSGEEIGFLPLAVAHPRVPRSRRESREARARLRAGERRAIAVSGMVQYYLWPYGSIALAILAGAAFAFGWMEPRLLAMILGATVSMRILTSMTTAMLAEYAAPAGAQPLDLAALFLAALCSWVN